MKEYRVNNTSYSGSVKNFDFETKEAAIAAADKMQKKRKNSISVYQFVNTELINEQEANVYKEVYNTKGEPLKFCKIIFYL